MNRPSRVTFDLALTSWDLEPSRRLGFVIATSDPLFQDFAAAGETVSILGGSHIEIPLNEASA